MSFIESSTYPSIEQLDMCQPIIHTYSLLFKGWINWFRQHFQCNRNIYEFIIISKPYFTQMKLIFFEQWNKLLKSLHLRTLSGLHTGKYSLVNNVSIWTL